MSILYRFLNEGIKEIPKDQSLVTQEMKNELNEQKANNF